MTENIYTSKELQDYFKLSPEQFKQRIKRTGKQFGTKSGRTKVYSETEFNELKGLWYDTTAEIIDPAENTSIEESPVVELSDMLANAKSFVGLSKADQVRKVTQARDAELTNNGKAWMSMLKWKITASTGESRIDSSFQSNAVILIEHDTALAGLFQYNEILQSVELTRSAIVNNHQHRYGSLREYLYNDIRIHLEKVYNVAYDKHDLVDAVLTVALSNKVDPFKAYLEKSYEFYQNNRNAQSSLIPEFFPQVLGAERSDLTTIQTKIFLTQLVQKTIDPYAPADFVLDLVGGQGVGKTRTLKRLGYYYYSDSLSDFTSKDNKLQLVQNILVNDDEMRATNKASFEELKAIISQTQIEIRRPYAASSERLAKRCVFARTTNNVEYLRDKTGDRRFMPIMCSLESKERDISEISEDEMMFLYGEAVQLFNDGFDPNKLTLVDNNLIESNRDNFKYVSETENILDQYLHIKLPLEWTKILAPEKVRYIEESLNLNRSNSYLSTSGNVKINPDVLISREFVTIKEICEEAFRRPASDKKFASQLKNIMDNHKAWSISRKNTPNGYVRGYARNTIENILKEDKD